MGHPPPPGLVDAVRSLLERIAPPTDWTGWTGMPRTGLDAPILEQTLMPRTNWILTRRITLYPR